MNITLTLPLGPPACLDDNTAYYGNNIEPQDYQQTGSSSRCQQRCQSRSECKFWTWTKATGKCYLKTSKAGEPKYEEDYGPNHVGNSDEYVSGSKNCTHVSHQVSHHVISPSFSTLRQTYGQKDKWTNKLTHLLTLTLTNTN